MSDLGLIAELDQLNAAVWDVVSDPRPVIDILFADASEDLRHHIYELWETQGEYRDYLRDVLRQTLGLPYSEHEYALLRLLSLQLQTFGRGLLLEIDYLNGQDE